MTIKLVLFLHCLDPLQASLHCIVKVTYTMQICVLYYPSKSLNHF